MSDEKKCQKILTVLDVCTMCVPSPETLPRERAECVGCKKKKQWYCPECIVPTIPVSKVTLPLRLDIIRGQDENHRKSTSNHALILSDSATLYTLPLTPTYADPSKVLVLFPSPSSKSVTELDDLSKFEAVMIIDTTWGHVGSVMQLPQFYEKPFQFVHIGLPMDTIFWRFNGLGSGCLSTIEASYMFFREWEMSKFLRSSEKLIREDGKQSTSESTEAELSSPCNCSLALLEQPPSAHSFDNLLLFFLAQYHLIQSEYAHGSKSNQNYSKRMRSDYITSRASGNVADPELHEESLKRVVGGHNKKRSSLSTWAIRSDVLDAERAAEKEEKETKFLAHTLRTESVEEIEKNMSESVYNAFLKFCGEEEYLVREKRKHRKFVRSSLDSNQVESTESKPDISEEIKS